MAAKTIIALRSIQRSLGVGKKCKPEDLEALGILTTPCQLADLQSCDDEPTASQPAEPEKLQVRINEIVGSLERAMAAGSEHPNTAPGAQNQTVRYSIQALTNYCGLQYEMDYDCHRYRLVFPVDKRIYLMPDLKNPIGEAMEFTLGRVRISTAYLPLPKDEAGYAVHARELFCLLAMARKSRQVSSECQSYPVSVLIQAERLRTLLTS
jgi:hypothetical protein